MSRPIIRRAGLLALLLVMSVMLWQGSAQAAPSFDEGQAVDTIAPEADSKEGGEEGAVRTYWCRVVTAESLAVYANSTTSSSSSYLPRGRVFATTGTHNGRYHLYNPGNDTWYGWVNADPRWTNYISHFCFG